MAKKNYSQKDYESDQRKPIKISSDLEKKIQSNPKLKELIETKDPNLLIKAKLRALDLTIAYLIRKGKDSDLPMDVLIEIANEYQAKLEGKRNE